MRSLLLSVLSLVFLSNVFSQNANLNTGLMDRPVYISLGSDPSYKFCIEKGICKLSNTLPPAKFKIVVGLANEKLISIESDETPGYFLRHQNSAIKLHPYAEGDNLYLADATFKMVVNPDGTVSFSSYNYSQHYITVTRSNLLFINIDPDLQKMSFRLTP